MIVKAGETCAGCGNEIEKYMNGNICEECFKELLQDQKITPEGLQTRYNWF